MEREGEETKDAEERVRSESRERRRVDGIMLADGWREERKEGNGKEPCDLRRRFLDVEKDDTVLLSGGSF